MRTLTKTQIKVLDRAAEILSTMDRDLYDIVTDLGGQPQTAAHLIEKIAEILRQEVQS